MTVQQIYKTLLFTFCSTIHFFSISQPDVDLIKYTNKYPESRGVLLENIRSNILTLKNNQLQIESKEIKSYFITSDKPNYFSEGEIYFSDLITIKSFEAYSLIPEGKKYKKVKVTEFQDSFDNDDAIFYDENKKRTFVFPSLVQGAKTYQVSSLLINEPRYFGKFFFESYLPVENSVFEMIVPIDVEFTAYKLGKNTEKIQYSQEKDGKNTIHRWWMTDLSPLKRQDDAMPISYYSPHLVIVINRYKDNDGKMVDVASNLQTMFNWYSSLLAKVDLSVSAEMQQITDSITRNKSNELEKLKSIYYWVQDNIKYIAFEHGMEGIIPRDPKKIMSKRYGDCKDMAMLIHVMAKSVGINTYPSWIGTRDIPYSYEQFPSMNVDNHMIVIYEDSQKKTYFLDATNKLLDINRPSSFTQSKQALAYLSSNQYKLFTVPEVSANENFISDSVYLRIVNDSLIGKGVAHFNGYIRQNFANILSGLNVEKIISTIESITKKGNNKYKIDTAYYNTLDRDSVLTIHYSFVIKDYITISGDEIFVNLNIDKSLKDSKIEIAQSPYPIFQSRKISWNNNFVLEIPEGYTIEYSPNDYEILSNYLSLNGKYYKNSKSIYLNQNAIINYLMLPTEEFTNYNNIIKKINQSYNQSVTLKKIKK